MKLPNEFDLYKHNQYADELFDLTCSIASTWMGNKTAPPKEIAAICRVNLQDLRKASAIITHLELAIDEVLKVPGVSE